MKKKVLSIVLVLAMAMSGLAVAVTTMTARIFTNSTQREQNIQYVMSNQKQDIFIMVRRLQQSEQ